MQTAEDLKTAWAAGVSGIVIDSVEEIDALGDLAVRPQRVLLRVTPGVDGHTHRAITTGVEGSKFGFALATGAAMDAVGRVLARPALRLVDLNCQRHRKRSPPASTRPATGRIT